MNSENLDNQGQTTGQDTNVDAKENSWEKQAKYFQSEKDKLFEENKDLKKYEKLGKVLEARPDIVENIRKNLSNEPGKVQVQKPDNFDPWEAYNEPKSESYKYRIQEMQSNIDEQVKAQVDKSTSHIQETQAMEQLKTELRTRGMGEEDINGFIEFSDKSPDEYGLDGILRMYEAYKSDNSSNQENPLDQVKRTQSNPAVGGVLGGQVPETPSDEDDMWKGVLGASRVGNKIP